MPAFWTGLLYDSEALDGAWDLVKDWSAEEREDLRNGVPVGGIRTPFRSTTVTELAKEALRLSRLGLKNRNRRNEKGQDETIYLAPLESIARAGRTMSDDLLDRYRGSWHGDINHIFEEYAF